MNKRRLRQIHLDEVQKQKILPLILWGLLIFSVGVFVTRLRTAIPFSTRSRLLDFGWYEYAFRVIWSHMPAAFLYQRWRELPWMHQYLQGTPWHIDAGSQFLYPPQFAVFFSWLAAFPVHAATLIWDALLTASYIIGVLLLIKLIQQNDSSSSTVSRSGIVLLLSIVFLWRPFKSDIYWGNSDSILFFLVTLTFYIQYIPKKHTIAGIPLGLAVLFKITPGILLVFFLFKNPKTALGAVLTIVIGTVLTWPRVGFKTLRYFLFHFGTMAHRSAELNGNGGNAPWNSSIKGVLELLRHTQTPWLTQGMITAVFAVYIAVVFLLVARRLFSRRAMSDKQYIGLLVLCLLLFTPVIESHYLTLALIPFLLATATLMENWSRLHPSYRLVTGTELLFAFVLINPIGGPMIRFYKQMIPVHYSLGLLLVAAWYLFPMKLTTDKK